MVGLNKNQTGLTLGSLFGILHAAWVVVVGIGFGQRLADWWHSAHFLTDLHSVATFSFGTAVIGIIGAFISGYILGWIFALLWNWFGEKIK